MLAEIGVGSLDELIDQTLPPRYRSREPLRLTGLPAPLGEFRGDRATARGTRAANRVLRSCIGMATRTPWSARDPANVL